MRVVATGAESTGKTTLVQALAAHYDVPWVPEFARVYAASVDHALTAADVEPIARGHLAQAELAEQEASGLILFDTDLLSTVLYSRYLYGSCLDWIEAAAQAHAADLYLLCGTDIAWIPDPGQRESPEARANLQPQFEALLEEWSLPFVRIAGSPNERLASAVQSIEALL
ncbi:MAG: hypothetical protein RhofKO_03740 [Rhodothermales bacterium]